MPKVQGHPVVVLPASGIHKQTFGILLIIQENISKDSNNNSK
jgi:hypothetical protein